MSKLDDLFREWHEDTALRKAEERVSREGPSPVRASYRGREYSVELLYGHGTLALVLVDARNHRSLAAVTVNLPGEALATGEVLIKSSAEYAGLVEALEAAGVVQATGEYAGTTAAVRARIAHPDLRRIEAQRPEPVRLPRDQDLGR